MSGWRQSAAVLGLVLIAAASANAVYFAPRSEGRSETGAERAAVSRVPGSRPYFVSASCKQSNAVREACRAAIRYLRALDLDRFEFACGALAPGTVQQAGGIKKCVTRFGSARGIRIRYGIHGAVETVLGTSIYFRTRAIDRTGPGIAQEMIVRTVHGEPRVWMVMIQPADLDRSIP